MSSSQCAVRNNCGGAAAAPERFACYSPGWVRFAFLLSPTPPEEKERGSGCVFSHSDPAVMVGSSYRGGCFAS
jgi:hypothetical protein